MNIQDPSDPLINYNFDSLDHLDLVVFTEEIATETGKVSEFDDFPILGTVAEAYTYYLHLIAIDQMALSDQAQHPK